MRWRGTHYALSARRVAILDTNYLMNKVKARVRSGRVGLAGTPAEHADSPLRCDPRAPGALTRPTTQDGATSGDKLAQQSEADGWPTAAETFQQTFEREFLPRVRFVDVGELFADEQLPVKIRTRGHGQGAPEAPTAQLAVLPSRTRRLVYAHDHDLYKPGVAPRPKQLAAVGSVHGAVEQGHAIVGAGNLAAHAAGYGSYGLTRATNDGWAYLGGRRTSASRDNRLAVAQRRPPPDLRSSRRPATRARR